MSLHHASDVRVEADGDRTITIERMIAADPARVWSIWTDPAHVVNWWGPEGFEIANCRIDLRIGGVFQLDMCVPDGPVLPCRGIIREVTEPQRLVIEGRDDGHGDCGAGLPLGAIVTVTFEARDRGTFLTIETRFPSVESRRAAETSGYDTSWPETLTRLEDLARSQA